MFIFKNTIEQGIDAIILSDEESGTNITVVPSCGASMQSFSIVHNCSILNIIDNIDIAEFKNQVEAEGFKSCKLSPFACRINKGRYQFADKVYTIRKFLLNGSAIHGLLYDAVFTVIDQHADEDQAGISLFHSYQATDKGYPFYYDCIITYNLAKNNLLTITTEVINKTQGLIPIQDGWHPYFTFGGSINDLQLEFQSKEMLEFNSELIPTGKLLPYQEFGSLKKIGNTVFDNCFTINFAECQPLCVLRDSQKKIQVEVYPGKNYPYLQIYTPSHRNSIGLENLSAAPDAFNNGMGLITLQENEKAAFTTAYKIRLLD